MNIKKIELPKLKNHLKEFDHGSRLNAHQPRSQLPEV
jgi:hypothetical protein